MGKITALRETKRRGRVNLYLDGRFALSLSADLVSSEGLQHNRVLTDDEIDSLSRSDRYQRCLIAATDFLTYRPRSISELRTKLERRGFDPETQTRVLESLKAKGLLDDAAFAQFWTENRESFSPRSRLLTRIELQKKGIARQDIERAIGSIDETDSAYRAASSRVKSMRWSDRQQFRRRLGAYLQRRGFGYEVIAPTLEKIWKDLETK